MWGRINSSTETGTSPSPVRTADKSLIVPSCWRRRSLEAGYHWMCAAQDATPDHGVAAWYDLIRGWSGAYPETTGYIIPTFLAYASVMREPEARTRAIQMADWEIAAQLPTGAVRSGLSTAKVAPTVFNTGQVIFGWTAAYQATKDKQYADAAQRAAQWLIRLQDDNGAWRQESSPTISSKVHTYNVRTAWGLAIAGEWFGESKWIKAACKNADWALTQQRENGWFDHNGFTDHEMPLLHTIGYTLESLVGMGTLLNREEYIEAAQRGVQPLIHFYATFGKLAGRYKPDWHAGASWRFLTGEAQIALVLLRLAKYHENDTAAGQLATHILEDLARIQDAQTPSAATYGGLAGSKPIWGGDGSFRYFNWAVKFYLDALLLTLFGADVQGLASSAHLSD